MYDKESQSRARPQLEESLTGDAPLAAQLPRCRPPQYGTSALVRMRPDDNCRVHQGLLNQPFFIESEYIPLPLTCTRI